MTPEQQQVSDLLAMMMVECRTTAERQEFLSRWALHYVECLQRDRPDFTAAEVMTHTENLVGAVCRRVTQIILSGGETRGNA